MKLFLIIPLFLCFKTTAQEFKGVGVHEFQKGIGAGEVQVLDVRRSDEYTAGHLKGALLADWTNNKEFEERVQYLDKTKPVYVYCLSGGRSNAAGLWMARQGFTSVINMEGGINAWKKSGKPVEESKEVATITDERYKTLVGSASLVLVQFGGEWCPPCKKMEPVIASLREEHNGLGFVKIDAAVQTGLMTQQGVEGIPTFILYHKGKEVWRTEGVIDRNIIDQKIRLIKP